jgi:succinoglycan biosynthesis protein ExoO
VSPDITVMIPVHNRADLIGRAIESVQSQTMTSWELVIVDDGSTDATRAVAQRYAATDPRVRVFVNERNVGVSEARNCALRYATGRFVTPLDSDDWFHPQRLERLVRMADLYGAQLLSDDLLVVRDGEERPEATLSGLCHETLSGAQSIDMAGLVRRLGFERDGIALGLTKPIIERQFLIDHRIRYDSSVEIGEDFWLLADCVAAGARFVLVADALYYYRVHAQQTTKTSNSASGVSSARRRLEAFGNSAAATEHPAAAAIARYHLHRMDVLTSYDSFIGFLKAGRFADAARCASRQPVVVSEFARRMPLAYERRRLARLGEPLAYDPLFGPHLSRRVPPHLFRAKAARPSRPLVQQVRSAVTFVRALPALLAPFRRTAITLRHLGASNVSANAQR